MKPTAYISPIGLLLVALAVSILFSSCRSARFSSNDGDHKQYSYLWKIGEHDQGWSHKEHVPREPKHWYSKMEMIPGYPIYGDSIPKYVMNYPAPKKVVKDRDVEMKGDTIYISSREFTIFVWDGQKVDGDIISLYMGDRCVMKNEELSKTKASVDVKIPEGQTGETLVLFAHNTGDIGENTATITIKDTEGEELFELKSNLDTSQGITLLLK